MNVYDIAARLPDPAVLRPRCQAPAMLDAIVSPQQVASMQNGSGDEWSIVFTPPMCTSEASTTSRGRATPEMVVALDPEVTIDEIVRYQTEIACGRLGSHW